MTVEDVSAAYGARSTEYIELFGGIEAAAEADRSAILAWARGVDGPVLDVGCGPGQWTAFLADNGVDVEGVDVTPEFVAAARRRHPAQRFRLGRAEDLGVGDGVLGGILAWYSLITPSQRRSGPPSASSRGRWLPAARWPSGSSKDPGSNRSRTR